MCDVGVLWSNAYVKCIDPAGFWHEGYLWQQLCGRLESPTEREMSLEGGVLDLEYFQLDDLYAVVNIYSS